MRVLQLHGLPPPGVPHLHVLPQPFPLLTIYTPPPAALDGRVGSVGDLGGGGGVEEKLLIHCAGRSLREHPVQWSHCTDEENESREPAAGQGQSQRLAGPQAPKLTDCF